MKRAEGRGQRAERVAARVRRFVVLCALPSALCALLSACHQKMANQPRYDPLEASDFFEDGMSARPRLVGTVARGELIENPFLETGRIGDQEGDGFPYPVTEQMINRGQERFNIFCSQCHGRVGDGNGMIPSRGYRRPPSFHADAARAWTTGHVFDVMTNGFGSMPSYRTMVPARDRWAIIAYIRVLQLSQSGTAADVPAAKQGELSGNVAPASAGGSPAKAGATTHNTGGPH